MFNNAGRNRRYFEDVFLRRRYMIDINLVARMVSMRLSLISKNTKGSLCMSTSSRQLSTSGRNGHVYGDKICNQGIHSCHECRALAIRVRVADVMPGIIDTPLWGGAVQRRPASRNLRKDSSVEYRENRRASDDCSYRSGASRVERVSRRSLTLVCAGGARAS